MPDHFDAAGGLERQPHFEYSPVAEPRECHDHITPEEQYVRSFSKFQVSQNDKKRSLQEKKQSHFDQISRKSHQANRKREKPEYPKHACHGKSSSPKCDHRLSTQHYTGKGKTCKQNWI